MTLQIGCVVEGHGELEALPILLRRLAEEIIPGRVIEIPIKQRTPKTRLLKNGELERAVELTARRVAPQGGLIVLLDSDDDCPGKVGPRLLRRARRARSDFPLAVILAKREFEAWFIAAANSLRPGLATHDLEAGTDPEAIRGAKEWVGENILREPYVETLHQPSLAARFDIQRARRAASFDKFYRDVSAVLRDLARP